jgi:hypothetical protein
MGVAVALAIIGGAALVDAQSSDEKVYACVG